jgi:hypothetical protein
VHALLEQDANAGAAVAVDERATAVGGAVLDATGAGGSAASAGSVAGGMAAGGSGKAPLVRGGGAVITPHTIDQDPYMTSAEADLRTPVCALGGFVVGGNPCNPLFLALLTLSRFSVDMCVVH